MPKPFRFRIYDKLPRWIYRVVTFSLNLAVGSYKHLSNPFSQIQGTSIHGRDGDRWGELGLVKIWSKLTYPTFGKRKIIDSNMPYTLEDWHGTWKWWFGRWFSFSIGWFLGSMLIFRGVSGGYVVCLEGIWNFIQQLQWFERSHQAISRWIGGCFLVRSATKPSWFKVTQTWSWNRWRPLDLKWSRKNVGLHNENLLWLWFLLYTFSRNGQPSQVHNTIVKDVGAKHVFGWICHKSSHNWDVTSTSKFLMHAEDGFLGGSFHLFFSSHHLDHLTHEGPYFQHLEGNSPLLKGALL